MGNFVDTGKFWQTYDCPEQPYFFEAGAIMTSIDASGGGNPVSDLITELTQGILPVYPTDKRQCNARGLTQLGDFMFQRMMDKKLIIEHARKNKKHCGIFVHKSVNPAKEERPAYAGLFSKPQYTSYFLFWIYN